MLTILHGSDLHFGKHFHASAAEAFRAFVEKVGPDLVVLSGDFTQRAKLAEYGAALEYLSHLDEAPLVVVPGNHDVPLYRVFERLFAPYRNYRKFVAAELDTVTRLAGAVAVGLNSAAPRSAIINGWLRRAQLEFASQAFAEADPAQVRILVVHHPLAPLADYEKGATIRGAARLLRAFHDMGVELVLSGHGHRAYVASSLDVVPHDGPAMALVSSGTTTSRRGRGRERGRNSLNVVRVSDGRFDIVPHLFVEQSGVFAPVARHAFPRGSRFLANEAEPSPSEALPAGAR